MTEQPADPLTAATLYISLGWAVVPLAPGSKACKDDDWIKLVFTPDDFRPGDNIGIRSTNGVVISDADCAEVVALADGFLPPTGAVYGRPSKPRSKRLYRLGEQRLDKTVVFKDMETGKTLLELRVNHQDMAPPSTHPDGEVLAWDEPPVGAGSADLGQLLRDHRLLATAAIVARYYAPPGARHDWCLALAGVLRQLTLTVEEAKKVVLDAGRYAGDKRVGDRGVEIKTTYAKAEDDPVTGGRKLEELAGAKFVASLRRVWGQADGGLPANRLDELNQKHAVIFQQSGELVVVTEERDTRGWLQLRFSSLETIRQLYPQQIAVGFTPKNTPITKKLGAAWLDHPKRRFYSGIELAPNGNANPAYYNLWQGFTTEPRKGEWPLFREHVREVIAAGDPRIDAFIIAWMAQVVQDPGHPAYNAIALRGGQGTGKSTFAKWFGALFGPHFLHLDSTRHLTGNFNAHLHNAIVVFADEAAWPGDKAGIGALRRMVTEDTISIERKGMDVLTMPNMIHLILASNEEWVAPSMPDERRFAVFDISDKRRNDRAYFKAVQDELFKHGGLAAMLYDLLEHQINGELDAVPDTAASFEQKQLSSSPRMRWWFEVLQDGDLWTRSFDGSLTRTTPGFEHGFIVDRAGLYEAYLACTERASRHNARGLQTELGMFLKSVMPEPFPGTYRTIRNGPRYWVIPSLKVCRETFEARFGTQIPWPAEHVAAEGDQSQEPLF